MSIVKNVNDCQHFKAGDNTLLCELLHPGREEVDIPYSIAHAVLESGCTSLPHRLKKSSEVYFILEGKGKMHIESESIEVGPGQAIVIPPGSWQHISNIGTSELKFLCIVHPMWTEDDEEIKGAPL
jgi:mannose-6-phosphate isomerase-like protein (cupin superfamily)